REERTGVVILIDLIWATETDFAAGIDQLLGRCSNVVLLFLGSQWTHRGALSIGWTNLDLVVQPVRQRGNEGFFDGLWDDDATDCGTFLTGLGGHLHKDSLDEGIKFWRIFFGIRAQDRSVE